jgi:hypothetical protein
MSDLTATQISDLRADIGDEDTPYAFTDAEFQRLWVRASENYNYTVVLALRQLLMNAAKFYDYVSGFTRQEQEKVFGHLKSMHDLWQAQLKSETQVNIVGITIIPPNSENKDVPNA